MMKKNGFTLVEIMVAVIIVGILAAVGVPKLFGVIAKAKAAEVPVAAGTYISLQNTYLHENNGVGSWKNIGYGAPGNGQTENFTYSGCIQGLIRLHSGGERMVGWQAFNIPNLNSCTPHSAWSVILNPLGEHELSYEHIVSSAECAALTSNWNVGNAGEGACEATAAIQQQPESSAAEEPESSDGNEEDSSASEPGSSASSQSSEANQDDKPAACNDIEKVNNSDACSGTAQGWVYVVECGFFAPKGNAKNKGLTIVEKKKDSDFSKYCNSSSSQSSSASSSATSSASNPSSSASNTESSGSGSGGGSGGSGGSGGGSGGTGDGTDQGTSAGVSSTQSTSSVTQTDVISSSEESSSSETPVVTDQNGEPFDMKDLPDTITYCDSFNGNGSCKNKHSSSINKSQCTKYDTSKNLCIEKAN